MKAEKVLFKPLYIPSVISVRRIFEKIEVTGKERNLDYVSVVLSVTRSRKSSEG